MSEEKQQPEDTDEMRPAGEDARVAEARREKKRIGEDGDAAADDEGASPDSPLSEDPGQEDTGAQS